MSKWLAILLFFTLVPALGQERKPLVGRVMADDDAPLPNVFVINKPAGTEVKTDAQGNFSIDAKPGDKLVVYSDNTKAREFLLQEASFANPPYVLSVEIKGIEIEEVVVTQTITSESLGLVPKGQKVYTPAEKRVLSYGGNTRGLSGAVNFLRGRLFLEKIKTKYAMMEADLIALEGLYTDTQLVNDFKIPEQYTKAFLYFAVEDSRISSMLKAKNYGAAKLILAELSLKYLETIAATNE